MLEISLQSVAGSRDTRSHLVLKGELLQGSWAERLQHGDLRAYVGDPESSLRMIRYTIAELSNQFSELTLKMNSPFPELSLEARFLFNWGHHFDTLSRKERRAYIDALHLTFRVSFQDWVGPWSIAAYDAAIRKAVDASGYMEEFLYTLAPEQKSEGGYWIFRFNWLDHTMPTDTMFRVCLEKASSIIDTAKVALAAEFDLNSLFTLFDFPQHVSTACEQYLLYFVQFLRDLDIKADATIKRQARQILFSVTPSEGAEALGRIREALAIYVQLPYSSEFAALAPAYEDIAVQQLQANIYHLKSQLSVAEAVLEAKDAQIEALRLSNFTYQQLLANHKQIGSISLVPRGTLATDVESLVPGVIEITRYEGKGFTVNLPELLRRLKRRFNQE